MTVATALCHALCSWSNSRHVSIPKHFDQMLLIQVLDHVVKKFFEQFEKAEEYKSEFASRRNYNENVAKEQAGLKQSEKQETRKKNKKSAKLYPLRGHDPQRLPWNKCIQDAKRKWPFE